MGLDPSKLSRDTFGVPEFSPDGSLKITGVSKRALAGQIKTPKESEATLQDLVKRVKKSGSKTDATIQLTREFADKLRAQNDPQSMQTLQKFVHDVKEHLIQREGGKTFGVARVLISRLLGGIGKLERLERELQFQPVQAQAAAAPKELEKDKEAPIHNFAAQVLKARSAAFLRAFPEGAPAKIERFTESTVAFRDGGALSSDICSPILNRNEVVNELREYAQLLTTRHAARGTVGSSVFKLAELHGDRVVVVAGTVAPNGKLAARFVEETIPQKMSPKEFLEALQKKYGAPLTHDVREEIRLFANMRGALEIDKEEHATMKERRSEIRALQIDDSKISTLSKADALKEIAHLSQKVEALQERIIEDIEGGERRLVANYKPFMENCFRALVSLQIRLQQKRELIEARGEEREGEVRARSKLFIDYPELCRQLSDRETEADVRACIEALSKTNDGKKFIEKRAGKFFELGMDYDHPTRIKVVAAQVKPNGKIGFKRHPIEIRGSQYEYEGKLYKREELLQVLKGMHGEPIDLELRAIAPTLALRVDVPMRIQ